MDPQFDSAGYVPSSPLPFSSPNCHLPSPTRTSRRKEKRNPTVTPRRFGRFFTPRSNLALSGLPTARRILGTLESSATNRQPISPQSLFSDALQSDPISPSPAQRLDDERKRKCNGESSQAVAKRRGIISGTMPPPQFIITNQENEVSMTDSLEGNLSDRRKATLSQFYKASRGVAQAIKEAPIIDVATPVTAITNESFQSLEGYQPQPIRKFGNRGVSAQLLNREHGYSSRAGRQYLAFPACDPRTETASFYSRSSDAYQCTSQNGSGDTIPFSLASCHSAPVTAIGDEQGFVRFLKTSEAADVNESPVDVHFKVHNNAIMNLTFSEDDLRLATACGDRTGKIVDTVTQTVAVELDEGHFDSLRQVSFQPGQANGSMLATSDRAGRIQIWDLRCSQLPINSFSTRTFPDITERDVQLPSVNARTVNTFDGAHERTVQGVTSSASVTAIHWLPAGREHLLLSASEANAAIKLWDTRYIKPRRQVAETPLAVTTEPTAHAWRAYGITSLALSSDAARLYAVCKDSTVYAYSTAHLMLGHAPDLLDNAAKRRPTGEEGLGPLYGFKHNSFRAGSFYVKCAMRRGPSHASELLAVGSSDSCAVLFPTDDRFLRSAAAQRAHLLDGPVTPSQSFSSVSSGSSSSSTVPIFRTGTALVRGHSREVSTPSWTHDGKLVTASDDYFVRKWQKGDSEARHLRQVGEFGGERHMAGWADVGADWDAEDDE